ncbi:MAG: hypothetical protein NZ534_03380, partial [Bacteroidia bacterium]|nr:hypothetical protein [Bacteroidia bacterium]
MPSCSVWKAVVGRSPLMSRSGTRVYSGTGFDLSLQKIKINTIAMRTRVIHALILGAAVLTGCKRENEKDKNEGAYIAAEDNSKMESEFQQIFDQSDNAVRYNPSGKTSDIENWLPECATVTRDTVGSVRTVVITFDSTGYGCLCRDGLYRKGTIRVEYSGEYRTVGATKT